MSPVLPQIPPHLNMADHFLGARLREGKGEKTAIVCGERRLTYAEVSSLANRFANVLMALDVVPEQRVLIALPDIPEFAGALFGTLKMGAVGVMANCLLNPEAILGFLEYTRATAVVVHGSHLSAFARAAADARFLKHIIVVGEGKPEDEEVPVDGEHSATIVSPGAELGPNIVSFEAAALDVTDVAETYPTHRDDAALWLFSGGTTGVPKGVVQTHRSFVNTTELYAKGVLGVCEDDVTLSVPKLYFGYATGSNLLFPFSVGATTVLFPERCTVQELFRQIAEHRPTLLINVPTMINHMLSHPGAQSADLSCLRLVTSAGEALPAPLYAKWKKTFGVELLDGLGTAEMWHVFVSNRPGDVKPGTLGKVVPGFEVRACDEGGTPVPDGEVGALWVRGGSRAIGYWQHQEKSEQAFRGEWYVSGDMIRCDEDGYITYCGRGDDMLKVGGKWLSPGEVEGCLMRHPHVRECAVVGMTDEQGLTKPCAHVVVRPGASVPSGAGAGDALAEVLKEHVRTQLEPYKAPREIRFSDDLPRTHLGKIDRGKLRRVAG